MYATVIELNTLTDTVRTASQNHNFFLIFTDRTLIFNVIRRVIISAVLRSTDVYAFPGFLNPGCDSLTADFVFLHLQDLAQIFIRKAVQFCLTQHVCRRYLALVRQQSFLLLNQLFHLLQKIVLDLSKLKKLLHGRTFSESLIEYKLPLAGRYSEHFQKLLLRLLMEILSPAQTVTSNFKASNRLLKSLFVSLSNTHHFSDCTHLCSQLILNAFEFLKSPARKLDHHIVSIWHVVVQSPIFSTRNLIQIQARSQHRRHQSNRKTCRFRS